MNNEVEIAVLKCKASIQAQSILVFSGFFLDERIFKSITQAIQVYFTDILDHEYGMVSSQIDGTIWIPW